MRRVRVVDARPWRRGALVAALLGAALATTSPARAEGAHVAWRAPAGCPSERELVTMVERALVYGWPPDVEADANVTTTARAFRVSIVITIRGERGARELEATSCERLARATALVIATAADAAAAHPEEPSTTAPPEPSTTAPPEPSTTAPPEPSAAPKPSPRPARRTKAPRPSPVRAQPRGDRGHLRLGAHAYGSVGVLPLGSLGVGLSGGIAGRSFALEATAFYWHEQHLLRGPRPGSGADVRMVSARLRGCRSILDVPPELGVCLGLEGGLLQGEGFGLREDAATTQPWGAVIVGLAARRRVTRAWAWSAGAEAGISVVRPELEVVGFGTVARASWGFARLAAGVELDFF